MNRKIIVKTQQGNICYCILDYEQNVEAQLAQVLGYTDGHGITARMTATQIQLVDYYLNDVIGAHDILSIEDTAETVSLQWNTIAERK